MTPTAAIYLLLLLLAIAGVAYFVEWCVIRALKPDPMPKPIRIAIWGIAALAVILVLLGAFDGYVALP